ncbi:Do family serine endopeptidase [Alteriqipengyuania sp. WL0013]|uniref:Do family serine endopeptidase n=1 Tax=Alteriqipengyuania sp. WL0013 TaxID=3110773 RepID=UPI002C18CC43|nr:Do family serine endopeptidase [Alteriqipengyuania sp. WL0013]MEB3415984.1 Do family serine endopeptidase [Alteriqipengyuania sp. WL0013]
MKPVRYAYSITTALLLSGATVSLLTGVPAGAQVAQNDDSRMSSVVPRAGAPASFADLTEQLQPAVVNIFTRQSVEVQNPFAGTPMARRFGNNGPVRREGQSLGSGFLISADGYIVTNNHVIAPGSRNATVDEITVRLADGTEYEAELVGADPASDLAVLKISRREDFPFVEFGDSANARAGDWVIAIGNPFGLGGTVTSGIISAVLRTAGGGAYDRYIQTDASINSGNSGGPLFDMSGNVIGINSNILSPSGGNVGIGFAIPAETAQPIVETLMAGRSVERGFLGIGIRPVDEDTAAALGIPADRGEIVQSLTPGQPAAAAGLREGDIVLEVNNREVTREQTLSFLVANIAPGTRIPLTIFRDGRERTVNVTVGQRPSEQELQQQNFDPESDQPMPGMGEGSATVEEALGLQVFPLTPDLARRLRVDAGTEGLVINAIDPSSDAATKGLRRGFVILTANYQPVTTVEQLEEVIAEAKERDRPALLLRIQPIGQNPAYVPVRLR